MDLAQCERRTIGEGVQLEPAAPAAEQEEVGHSPALHRSRQVLPTSYLPPIQTSRPSSSQALKMTSLNTRSALSLSLSAPSGLLSVRTAHTALSSTTLTERALRKLQSIVRVKPSYRAVH